jgi:hypothetical protein
LQPRDTADLEYAAGFSQIAQNHLAAW